MSRVIDRMNAYRDVFAESIIIASLNSLEPPIDIDAVARKCGILLRKESMHHEDSGALKVVAITPYSSGMCSMVVNSDEDIHRQRFMTAHLLAHFFSYDARGLSCEIIEFKNGSSTLDDHQEEVLANDLAAAFLIPRKAAEKAKISRNTDAHILFGVSKEALEYRINRLTYTRS